jgi:hypothetical protein
MTRRRAAKARVGAPSARVGNGVPACLQVGPCIEVWAAFGVERLDLSAWRRFRDVREWWLDQAGVTDRKRRAELFPSCIPWSVKFLSYRGQAERVGRPAEDIVADRLARAGCTVADLPALADEAQRLHTLAARGSSSPPRTSAPLR